MGLNPPRFKSRKVLRKEARKAKKQRRHEYYTRRGKPKFEDHAETNVKQDTSVKDRPKKNYEFKNLMEEQVDEIKKEKKQKQMLDEEIRKKRIERLMQDNQKEDKEMKMLEKQLKFRKGKRSGAFALDGLDYLLDVCDGKITNYEGERTFEESDEEFENDLATIAESKNDKMSKKKQEDEVFLDESDMLSNSSDFYCDVDSEEDDISCTNVNICGKTLKANKSRGPEILSPKGKQNDKTKRKKHEKFLIDYNGSEDENKDENFDLEHDFKAYGVEISGVNSFGGSDIKSNEEIEEPPQKKTRNLKVNNKKRKEIDSIENVKTKKCKNQSEKEDVKKKKKKKKNKLDKTSSEEVERESAINVENDEDVEGKNKTHGKNSRDSGTWEDIYGRTRDRDGNIVKVYKPPHLRKIESSEDNSKNKEKLIRLKRQLKGLLNRLAENNMTSISSEIERLYMSHSRNEMNETLKDLFTEAIVTEVLTPERLVAEHAMLIAILHANIGSEIGAHFLQFFVTEFNRRLKDDIQVEDKHINNLLLFIMHLYNFQIFHSKLMYDLIYELLKNLQEKQIELLLMALRTVGFSLRKRDPMALKDVVLKIQEQANTLTNDTENFTRIKYMLEIVSAIKNNNVSKIPNYNPELVEHLKKCLKVIIRKGNYSSELNISLQDLLNAEEHGRWWVVGSAWSGSGPAENTPKGSKSKELNITAVSFSQKLLNLAKKQRMNTDVRRTVFCTLMSADDYLDAFEKLMKLGLKGPVEREIINVLLHCSLQEKDFNPYYFHLANKFCIFDRKYQMMIQYAVWDKVKELRNMLPVQVTNLAKLLGNIIANRGLPLSVLKIIQFAELDKICVKFVRQVLLTILLTDEETVANVFYRIVNSPKLKIFRDSIRLFMNHFLLKNIKSNSGENSDHLIKMIDISDRILTSSDLRMIF